MEIMTTNGSRSCLQSQPEFELIYDALCRSVKVNITFVRVVIGPRVSFCKGFEKALRGLTDSALHIDTDVQLFTQAKL